MKPVLLPVKVSSYKKCHRCGSGYPASDSTCPHCDHLSDGPELEAFKQQRRNVLREQRRLGSIFIILAMVLVITVVTGLF